MTLTLTLVQTSRLRGNWGIHGDVEEGTWSIGVCHHDWSSTICQQPRLQTSGSAA